MVGILDLHSGTDQVYFSELFGTYDRYWFARYAQYGSQETGSWLLVSNYTLPISVPEPSHSLMLLAGLGLLGVAVRRKA
ncbi:PEP-CTERM sorting domain-containing protein [Methylophilus medardicus]|uniref:PEP-CTERM sorting domain-containing protein n=2 Tax=Methylophilus medardicus TaxID=2588534 RepID=A0A5B8CVK9_9PROT|nr:PEP-CTERM sorting domain-containing protein [Methylophilus medardicus]QDC50378.1 PEP-CTERM sorting domain-containing protein [Methylophilus medardicus]QDC54083.1 PEP-CTERM sorting domain-containing protein [Methylophilus medardicus]